MNDLRLPSNLTPFIHQFGLATLKVAILNRRNVIRYHRDQKGDHRCWVDDHRVWWMLDDTVLPPKPSSFTLAMRKCEEFYRFRNAPCADKIPPDAILDPTFWDHDLVSESVAQLSLTLIALQRAIREHRDVVRPITFMDDRRLYQILPEKLVADFRLPPEQDFLGEAKAPHAGCPSFWRSHENCGHNCNISDWGPCNNVRV